MDSPFPPQLDHLWELTTRDSHPVKKIHTFTRRLLEIYKTILILYGFKALTAVIFIASLLLSETIFSEMYMKQVYLLKHKAPSLLWMIGIMVLLVSGMLLFAAALTYLLHLMFMNNTIFSPENYFGVLVDIACFIALLILFSLLIASVLQKKTYFKYSVEGLRAIRALREIMLYLLFMILIPYSQMRAW